MRKFLKWILLGILICLLSLFAFNFYEANKKVENPFIYEYGTLKMDFGEDDELTYRMPSGLSGESKNVIEVGFKSTFMMNKNGKMDYIQLFDPDGNSFNYPTFHAEEGGSYWFGFTFFKDKVIMDYFYATGDDPVEEVHIHQTYHVKNGRWQLKKEKAYQRNNKEYLEVGRKKVKQALSVLKKNDINYETLYQGVKNTQGASDAEIKTLLDDYREYLKNDDTELKNIVTNSQLKVEKLDSDTIKIYPINQEFYGTNHLTMSQIMADEKLIETLKDNKKLTHDMPNNFVLTFNAKTNELSISANNFYELNTNDYSEINHIKNYYSFPMLIKYRYTDTVKLEPTEVDGVKTYQFANSQEKIRFPDFFSLTYNRKEYYGSYFSFTKETNDRIIQRELKNNAVHDYILGPEHYGYYCYWSDTVETLTYQDFEENDNAQDYLRYLWYLVHSN